MRRMSFALTTDAVRNRTKTVTRRIGWMFLKPGDRLLAVDKIRVKNAQKLGVIEVVSARVEPIWAICKEAGDPCALEGFPNMTPEQFARMFIEQVANGDTHVGVNRIEFRYVEEADA